MIEINVEKFNRLLNGEKVYFGRQPIQHGKNIFTYQLNRLAQGEIVEPYMDFKFTAKLSDEVKVEDFLETMIKSPLNEVFGLFYGFVMTHPKKDEIMDGLRSVFGN